MAQCIAILPENLTNKIAAGEVVERPASVIKELVENSLDAGATEIHIEINAGGRRLIRVSDNGIGMSREDALLSLERHATSKIKSADDLDHILTLGFRGEALPSVASVSRFTLSTRQVDSVEGTEIVVEGGRVRDVRACGMAPGTVVSVEQLFYNIPARLKFMKSSETEVGHSADIVTRMAVARPDVAFTCMSDGRELVKLPKSDLQRRVSQVVGRESTRFLYDVRHDDGYVAIDGFVSAPALAKSNGSSLYTYINGRFVRDKIVQHAIMQAYRGVLDRGRYPVVALFVSIDPGEVDVNVHPTKHEVRFRCQSVVHDAIQAAVTDILKNSPWLQKNLPHTNPSGDTSHPGQAYRDRVAAAAQVALTLPLEPASDIRLSGWRTEQSAAKTVDEPVVREPDTTFVPDPGKSSAGYFSALGVIGQFHDEYIICQRDEELIIIDQHAASERVAYQQLQQQYRNGALESQRLLFPETIELSYSEVATAEQFGGRLAEMGFEVEPFGGTTLLVSAVPRIAASQKPMVLIQDILAEFERLGTTAVFDDILENVLSRIACHAVIRGCHRLENLQIRELLSQMDATDFAASCPHGRPVSHTITLQELQKIFKRT